MKKQSLRIFLMFSLFAILAVSSAHAQTRTEMTANIPFSFSVADKSFPAGEYTVSRLNPQSDKAVIMIKSDDGHLSKIVLTMPVLAAKARETAKLVFNRYGEAYCLAQIWTVADSTGLELPQSKTERELARNAKESAPERMTIALNVRRR